jgi:hypothetical protein
MLSTKQNKRLQRSNVRRVAKRLRRLARKAAWAAAGYSNVGYEYSRQARGLPLVNPIYGGSGGSK